MKILHIITSLELGGAEKLLVDIVNLQREKGEDVDVLVLFDKKNVFTLDSITSKYNSKTSYKNIFEILSIIKKGKYNIVHTHLTHAQFWTALASYLDFTQFFKSGQKKRRYITSEHSTYNNRRDKKIFKIVEKVFYKRYSKVICITKAVQDSLIKWLEDKKVERYPIIDNGVNLSAFKNATPILREKIGVEDKDRVLVMAARLNKAKDHETLLHAMTLLPKKYKLLLVGEGDKREELEKLGAELRLGDRVKFLGVRIDIPNILKASDIAVQSSHYEGFGLAAVEAMAAGIPIIGSDVDGLRDTIGDAGILFDHGDFKGLAKKILAVDALKEKNEILEKQRKRSEEYSLEKSVDKYLKLYREILK